MIHVADINLQAHAKLTSVFHVFNLFKAQLTFNAFNVIHVFNVCNVFDLLDLFDLSDPAFYSIIYDLYLILYDF